MRLKKVSSLFVFDFFNMISSPFNSPSKRLFLLLILAGFLQHNAFAQKYKQMMRDNSINFYDVVKEAESHFKTIDKTKKGSGWKGFQRWVNDNEYKYYPDGVRSNEDPYFVSKQYQSFQTKTPFLKSGSNTWTELGPVTPGQIAGHYSFGMGRVASFYVDPNNSNILYLGSRTGGFWKSTDGGTTWSGGSTDFLPACGVNTITASPTNSDSILININNSNNHYTHGIYRSVDGGDSWSLSNFSPANVGWGGLGSNREIYKIKYHPTIPDLIFIGTRTGLYRSDDNLQTWSIIVANDDFTDIDFHPTNPNIVYAYAKNKADIIFVSTDAGLNFSQTTVPGNGGGNGTVQVSADCPNCVYFMSNNGLWKSTNEGISFSLISTPGESDAGFAVSDVDDSKILAGYVDAAFSYDGGANFEQVTSWYLGGTNGSGNGNQVSYNTSTDYIHADLQAAECLNGIFYACTDGFLVSSADNGRNWKILSEDIAIRMNYNVGVSQSNHYRAICGSQDNGTSVQTENGWVEMYGADGMEGIIHPLNDDWMIGSVQYGTRRKTIDGGQSSTDVTPADQTGYWQAPIVYDPNNQMTIYSFGENVFKSEDFGETWTQLGSPSFSSTIQFASIAENNSQILAATNGSSIELSNDGGSTWSNIKSNLPSYSITDVVFDPNDDNTLIVTYGRYQDDNSKVYITHNQGNTWQNITYNLNNMPVRSAVIDYTTNSNIYVGTEIGVYTKAMNDVQWTLYNPALPNTSIKEMEIMWGSNTIKATTWGRGLWEYTLVDRATYPAIKTTQITQKPTMDSPKEGVEQFVTSTIEYDNTLQKAWVEWSVNSPTFGNVIPMHNTTGNEWVSDEAIPNNIEGSKMFFKVFALGTNGDTSETYKFNYTVHAFNLCNSSGSNDGTNYHLKNVTVANVNNSTGNDTYTYYGNETVNLEAGQTYSLSLTASTGWDSNDFAAWIDYNQDAVFSSEEEIMYSQNAASSNVTVNFTVPLDAVSNETITLRTRVSYWATSNPCGTTLGEVEDYAVIISNCTSPITQLEEAACESYTWSTNGETYTESGIYRDTLQNQYLCDSIIALDLTIHHGEIRDVLEVHSCKSYTWDRTGIKYTQDGVYRDTVYNQNQCDSIFELILSIDEEQYIDTTTIVTCEEYYWPLSNSTYNTSGVWYEVFATEGYCDSVFVLDLTLNDNHFRNYNETACIEFTWDINGETYNQSGTYYDSLQTVNGCDSVSKLILTIENVDVSVTSNQNVLTANANSLQYQWIDCGTMQPISGATNQSYIADKNGSYSVIVNDGNCSDTSECFAITTIGISENNLDDIVVIYPNPSSGQFTIEFKQSMEDVEIRIITNDGKQVLLDNRPSALSLSYDIDLPSGLYHVLIQTSTGNSIQELIIQ
jgi:photosystem II stability/assembly factor-like uncharacterized protein